MRAIPKIRQVYLREGVAVRAAAVSELIFEDCRIPGSCMMGQVGDGFKIAMSGLDSGRIGIAAQACGVAHAALEEAVEYTKQRVQFGKPLAKNEVIQFKIADMEMRTEAARQLCVYALNLMDQGQNFSVAAAE